MIEYFPAEKQKRSDAVEDIGVAHQVTGATFTSLPPVERSLRFPLPRLSPRCTCHRLNTGACPGTSFPGLGFVSSPMRADNRHHLGLPAPVCSLPLTDHEEVSSHGLNSSKQFLVTFAVPLQTPTPQTSDGNAYHAPLSFPSPLLTH